MRPNELLPILAVSGRLKTTLRHCFTAPERKESVADHSWRIALMAMLLHDELNTEFPDADMDRVIEMCLIHDLGEAFTGDIPTFVKTGQDEEKEDGLFADWIASFPTDARTHWQELFAEMQSLETVEAKIYKALDKLEAVISHNESDISTWLPLEYDLQFSYGKENVEFSKYFKELKQEIDQVTKEKIRTTLSQQKT